MFIRDQLVFIRCWVSRHRADGWFSGAGRGVRPRRPRLTGRRCEGDQGRPKLKPGCRGTVASAHGGYRHHRRHGRMRARLRRRDGAGAAERHARCGGACRWRCASAMKLPTHSSGRERAKRERSCGVAQGRCICAVSRKREGPPPLRAGGPPRDAGYRRKSVAATWTYTPVSSAISRPRPRGSGPPFILPRMKPSSGSASITSNGALA